MTGSSVDPREYQVLSNLYVDLGQRGDATNLARYLDTLEGYTACEYELDDLSYTRELIASAPSGVLGFLIQANTSRAISLNAYLQRSKFVQLNNASVADGIASILMKARTGEVDYSTFTARVRVVVDGGNVTANGAHYSETLTWMIATVAEIYKIVSCLTIPNHRKIKFMHNYYLIVPGRIMSHCAITSLPDRQGFQTLKISLNRLLGKGR